MQFSNRIIVNYPLSVQLHEVHAFALYEVLALLTLAVLKIVSLQSERRL